MAELAALVDKVRSKNAGPFWITLDIFCGSAEVYRRVSTGLDTGRVADLVGVSAARMKRFEIAELNVIKLSFPRSEVQGTPGDRDMHGASFGALLGEIEID